MKLLILSTAIDYDYGKKEQVYGMRPVVYHTVSYLLTVDTITVKVPTLISWLAITNIMTKQNANILVQYGTNIIHFSGVAYSGLIWLRIRTQWGLLWTRYWTFRFRKMPRSTWVAVQPADFRKGLSSMELVNLLVGKAQYTNIRVFFKLITLVW
jgi:hypothetical protein